MFVGERSEFILFLLVFARISGAILLNPVLGRKNIPVLVKVGISLATSLCVFPSLESAETGIDTTFQFIFAVLKELFIGYSISYIMQLVMSYILTAGEMIDMQLGLSMSKIYDPSSNLSMALSGTIYNLLFTMLFFLADGHLTLIRLICETCRIFKVGIGFINFEAAGYIVLIFGDILLLSAKLALPIIAAELLTEAGFGYLMRSVPQINMFMMGLQIKLGVGLLVLLISIPTVLKLMDSSMTYMFEKINIGISNLLTQ
jgi:flagellar biosynthetic protein FliR